MDLLGPGSGWFLTLVSGSHAGMNERTNKEKDELSGRRKRGARRGEVVVGWEQR